MNAVLGAPKPSKVAQSASDCCRLQHVPLLPHQQQHVCTRSARHRAALDIKTATNHRSANVVTRTKQIN
eukprot:2765757-Amphidinium_carterae.1